MGKILAPFAAEQVEALNRFQTSGDFHPFACGKHKDEDLDHHVVLVAFPDGWHCSREDCAYRQNWAHDFMVEYYADDENSS